MPIACLALAALVAVAVSRLRWPGTAAMVCLLLLVDLRIGLFHATAADEHNRAYAALRDEPAGRCSTPRLPAGSAGRFGLPLLPNAGSPRGAGRVHDDGATQGRRALARAARRAAALGLAELGIRYLAVHLDRPNPCGGQLLARDGPIATYSSQIPIVPRARLYGHGRGPAGRPAARADVPPRVLAARRPAARRRSRDRTRLSRARAERAQRLVRLRRLRERPLWLLDRLELDQVTVAGHSLGGYVALLAASRSDRIGRVLAIDVKSDWTDEDAAFAERVARRVAARRARSRGAHRPARREPGPAVLSRTSWSSSRNARSSRPKAAGDFAGTGESSPRSRSTRSLSWLASLPRSRAGRLAQRRHAAGAGAPFRRGDPGRTLEIVDGAGHHVELEAPGLVAERILELARLTRADERVQLVSGSPSSSHACQVSPRSALSQSCPSARPAKRPPSTATSAYGIAGSGSGQPAGERVPRRRRAPVDPRLRIAPAVGGERAGARRDVPELRIVRIDGDRPGVVPVAAVVGRVPGLAAVVAPGRAAAAGFVRSAGRCGATRASGRRAARPAGGRATSRRRPSSASARRARSRRAAGRRRAGSARSSGRATSRAAAGSSRSVATAARAARSSSRQVSPRSSLRKRRSARFLRRPRRPPRSRRARRRPARGARSRPSSGRRRSSADAALAQPGVDGVGIGGIDRQALRAAPVERDLASQRRRPRRAARSRPRWPRRGALPQPYVVRESRFVPEAQLEDFGSGLTPVIPGLVRRQRARRRVVVRRGRGGRCAFENEYGDPPVEFTQLGINLTVLEPGQTGLYHAEANQEAFLVLSGECALLIEDQERRLRPWDSSTLPRGPSTPSWAPAKGRA